MKKIFISLALAAMSFGSAYAAKAFPGAMTVTQADGTQLTIFAHGDEDFNWYTADDGTILVQEGYNYYIASIDGDGNLSATQQLAHNAGERTPQEQALASQQAKDLFAVAAESTTRQHKMQRISINDKATPAYFPHSGSPKALVILVQFPDKKFVSEDPKAVFNYYLNAKDDTPTPADFGQTIINSNSGSVSQYFYDCSAGSFTPQFDVVGPVTVSESYTYYGKNSGNSKDVNYKQMVQEACNLVDSQVDFSTYDSNHDGNADLVYIIYAGYGESIRGNSSDCLWPKTSNALIGTYDNTQVRWHGINNELNYYPGREFKTYPTTPRLNGIGLFCHEFSHALGLPDFYCTSVAANTDYQCMEYWSLMDSGEYTNNGYTPTPYTPWEMEVMGWFSPTLLSNESPAQISLKPFDEERKAYKIQNPTDGQYLLLQNIQNQGWYSKMLGKGLLIYRIDYPNDKVSANDKPNNRANVSPAMTIVPADGELISSYSIKTQEDQTKYLNSHYGDPFPGTSNKHEIEVFALNKGVKLSTPLYNIAESEEGIITFDYLKRFPTAIDQPITSLEDADKRIFTLDGRYMGTDAGKLGKGIYIIGKKKVVKP